MAFKGVCILGTTDGILAHLRSFLPKMYIESKWDIHKWLMNHYFKQNAFLYGHSDHSNFAQRFQASMSFRCQNILANLCLHQDENDTFTQKETTSTLTGVNRMFFTYADGVNKWNLFWRELLFTLKIHAQIWRHSFRIISLIKSEI